MKRWDRFLSHVEADLRLWIFLCAYLCVFRAIFIALFRDRIAAGSSAADVTAVLVYGLRYDAMIASYAILIPLLGSVLAALSGRARIGDGLRRATATISLALAALLCVVTVGYYREYGETFNERLFGLYYDDTRAIATTVWKSYHPLLNLAAILVLAVATTSWIRRLLGRAPRFAPRIAAHTASVLPRALLGAVLVVGLVGGMRGSFGRRPAQLKDAAITGDTFLDQSVLNPFTSLRYALQQEARLAGASGIDTFLPDRDVAAAARRFQGTSEDHADLDRYLVRTAEGPSAVPPRHIFVIVGEGLSAWPLAPPYDALRLGDELNLLAQQGVQVQHFLPAAYGTIESLGAIMTGLAEVELRTHYQPTARSAYPTSIAPIFRRLGYRTRFFYGGFLSWQRVGDFARNQGFEEVHGGASMGAGVTSNEWGVDDEDLMKFVLESVPDDMPSFNLIMTTSLHPPYDVDVAARGFEPRPIPANLASRLRPDASDSKFLGHYWYANRCIAGFVRSASERLEHALFAVTGDHPSRVDVLIQPSLFELRAVPLILYGPEVLAGRQLSNDTSGSHIDIAPTLIELAAPAGFSYHALGRSLFASAGHPLGIGQHTVIDRRYILDLRHGARYQTMEAAEAPGPDVLARWRALHDEVHGLAWWRIKHGPELGLASAR